ncbi:MAG: class I SAM-dependent methyltransferase [Actinomycetota bacterium]
MSWSEDDSGVYRRLAPVAVPARRRQLASVTTLLPFAAHDVFTLVELGSGEGILSHAIALAFPQARIVALDGSESMRSATSTRLSFAGHRVIVAPFELQESGWRSHLDGVDAVVSSLVIHHLDGTEKQSLYTEIGQRTSDRAALVIADLVAPVTEQVGELLAATWDEDVDAMAGELGDPSLGELFRSTEWNYYRHPDPVDRPSPLAEQLTWIERAGFTAADCFWMEAGHAIFGGYKPRAGRDHVGYERALEAAREALDQAG